MQRRRRHPGLFQRVAAAVGASFVLLACSQLLGDIEVDTEPLTPGMVPGPNGGSSGGGGGGVVGIDTPCEPGDSRCDEAGTLQACVRFEPGSPGGWLPQTQCGSPELCVAGPPPSCIPAACQRGEGSCVEATPRVCNAARTGWEDLAACESAAHCSTLAIDCPGGAPCCRIDPCTPGELRCNEGRLEECQADLSGYSPLATCQTPELCLSGLAACDAASGSCSCQEPACEVGATRCTGANLEVCNAGRTGWDPVSTCASPELCEIGRTLTPAPRCEAPACTPDQFVCEGASLLVCKADLTGFELSEPCIGPAFCNAAAGQCDPAPCQPGERSCNGAQIQVCAADQTGFEPEGFPCATAELCIDNRDSGSVRCDPPVCNVDQFDCFGSNQLQVCNDGRNGFEPSGPPCLRPDLCSAARRRCDFCVPGRVECTIDNLSTRTCALSGNFFGPETFCPLGCVPATGQCRTCNIGTYSCTNGNLSRCNDGRSLTPLNRGTDCSNGQQVSCINGVVVQAPCAAGLFCGGTGQCLCTAGDLDCAGDTLLVCNGTAFVPGDQCQGGGDVLTTCDDGDLREEQCDSDEECEDADGPTCGGPGPGGGGPGGPGGPGGNDDDDDFDFFD